MGNNRKLQFAIRAALAAAAASASVPIALSQTVGSANTASTSSPALEEVVVTGSRLKLSPNDVSISPVTSVSAIDIAQTGLVRAEDILNNLPQVIAENSSGQAISSNGTSTVSLRGLGSWRTLVLINGRRMMPGAGDIGTVPSVSASADIGQVPTELLDRVDVLTGGASSVYGADAVAGVVNFVLNTHFEGIKVDADYGMNRHENNNQFALDLLTQAKQPLPDKTVEGGFNKSLSIIMGSNFADGKGNATAYFTYLHSNPVVGYQYDYAGCTLNTPSTLPSTSKLKCGGSSSSATGRFLDLGLVSGVVTTLADRTVDKATGAFRQYTSADSYNYGALSFLQRGAEKYTAGSFVNYDVNDSTNLYSEFMFARNTSVANYGPSGLFAFGTPSISCSNPLFTAGEKAVLCSPANIAANQAAFGGTGDRITLYAARRSVESGPRVDNYISDAMREVLGVKGKFADAWSYDAYAQLGITQMHDDQGGYLGTQQINNALDVVPDTRPGTKTPGAPVCQSLINGADPNCVPWNIWAPGGVTKAQLAYLTVPSTYSIKTTEYIGSGSVTGDLGKYGIQIPSASSGLAVNVGAEYREERYDFDPDYIFMNGFASGGNGAAHPIHGGFHVVEGFTEMRLPIISDKPGAYLLSTDAGFRYSSYTSGFNTKTYKFGVEWAPIQDVRLRADYNRAVRAPSVADLFAPSVVGAGGTADPCWGPAVNGLVNGHTAAFCANTGVTAAEFGHILANPAAQINTSNGGNMGLTPEIADTYTFGFVFQPRVVPGLVASIDYYNIVIKNTIASLTSNTIVNDCGITGDPQLCGLIHRGPGTGSLWFNTNNFVNGQEVNIGKVQTRGIDLASHYQMDMGAGGKIALALTGTRTLRWLTQPIPSGGTYDCTGYFGSTCGAPTPKWRHVLNTTWMSPYAGLDFTVRWRYIGPTKSDRVSQDPQLSQAFYAGTSQISGYSYVDLSAAMPLGSSGISLRVGVNNIADKEPPIIANGNYSDCPNSSCNDNTWVGTYDTLGRYLYAHVTAKF